MGTANVEVRIMRMVEADPEPTMLVWNFRRSVRTSSSCLCVSVLACLAVSPSLLRADSNVGLMRFAEGFGDQNVFEARLVQQAAEFFAAKELETALLLKLQQKSG